jgi:hypothetical protein
MRARVRGLEKKLKRAALALSGVSLTLLSPALTWATSTAGGRTMGQHAQPDPDRSGWAGGPRAGDERLRWIGGALRYRGRSRSRRQPAGSGWPGWRGGAGCGAGDGLVVPLLTDVVLSGGDECVRVDL